MDNPSFVVYLFFGELSWAIFYLKNLVKIDKYLRDIVVFFFNIGIYCPIW